MKAKKQNKKIVRGALIHFYNMHSYPDVLEQIKNEGYTHIKVFPAWRSKPTSQGFTIEQVEHIDPMVKKLDMGLMFNTSLMKYDQNFLKANPNCRMRLNTEFAAKDSDAIEVNWCCPFQPENLNPYIEFLKRIATLSSVTHINVNDEAYLGFSNGIGCYCDYCCEKYIDFSDTLPPTDENWEDENWHKWIQWRFDQWIYLHKKLCDIIHEINPDIIVGVAQSFLSGLSIAPVQPSPWQHANDNARLGQVLDTVLVAYYHGLFDFYRPMVRGITEVMRIYNGALLDKPVSFAVQGFQPPGASVELHEKDGTWMGVLPQALGSDNITPHTYELMKTIPEVEQAYLATFILDSLFEQTEPDFYCSIVHGMQSETWDQDTVEYDQKDLVPVFDLIRECGFNYRALNDNCLNSVKLKDWGPLIFPNVNCLSLAQIEKIKEYVDKGGNILIIGNFGSKNEKGVIYERSPAWDLMGISSIEKTRGEFSYLDCKYSRNPIFNGIKDPIVIKDPYRVTVENSDIIAEIDFGGNRLPGLLINKLGEGRCCYLCGLPHRQYIAPGDAILSPCDNVGFFRNLIHELKGKPPIMWIKDFPPRCAYQKIRSWDRRNTPTIELLPQKGDRLYVGILASYLGENADIEVCVTVPENKHPAKVFDGLKENKLKYVIDSKTMTVPISLCKKDAVIPIVIEWDDN